MRPIWILAAIATVTAESSYSADRSRDPSASPTEAVVRLAEEVRDRGWIVYAARSGRGDWDLYLSRPDGSERLNITRTPEANEAAPQFSRDGSRLLHRRLPRDETIEGDSYGTQGSLVLSASDGTDPQVLGEPGEYPWASWGPQGKQIACLSVRGISFIDLASLRVTGTLPRNGYFQQMTWSPDGRRLSGVTNSHGAVWTVAYRDVEGGASSPVSKFQCCTPDWFPDSRRLIFSNRPAGQPGNEGKGWTQLWMADDQGGARQLVFGEDGRHVYGGKISPDGQYVLFTGNVKENGNPEHRGAPMGLMRLADAPMVSGSSQELRKHHPRANAGPLLVLPDGWEPDWTAAELNPRGDSQESSSASLPKRPAIDPSPSPLADAGTEMGADAVELASELRQRGWIAFAAATGLGDWDLYRMRPDGSQRRQLTDTREFNEAGVRIAPDGRHMLYYRIPRGQPVSARQYALHELVVADADGGDPVSHGMGFHWASWGPDGKQISCLGKKKIQVFDIESHRMVQEMPRRGIVWQLNWSPDGHWFIGTANGLGPFWNIGRIDRKQSAINNMSEPDRYNCTPDWMPDSRQVLYSRGIIPEVGGWAQMWVAGSRGETQRMLYAERGRHVYGAAASPDGQYLAFTRSTADQGSEEIRGFHLAVIRWKDTPMVGGPSPDLERQYPDARHGPRLDLGEGWEPYWTDAELGSSQH